MNDQLELNVGHFNGPNYEPEHDHKRLAKQHIVIRDMCLKTGWVSLAEIAGATGYPESSISAQLRHLRKPRFGSYIVSKRVMGNRKNGLYQYKVRPSTIVPTA